MKKINDLFFCGMLALLSAGCAKQQTTPSTLKPTTAAIAHATAANGALSDTNIKYFGRWDFTSSTQYMSYWGGAYFRVGFTGTTVKIKVGNTSNYFAKIDNGPWVSYLNVTGTVNLTPTALAAGNHILSVAQGKDYSYVFNFQGLVLDTGATTSAPPVSNNLIEWIGDSITAGYTDEQANVADYAWVCSELLGTEHTQIAYPGICLVSGFTTDPGMDVQYFKLQNASYPSSLAWDFTKYTPKLVVINLGTNDNGRAVPDSTLQSSYTTFLSGIRTKFPVADIFVMRTFIGVKVNPTVAAVNARITAGDTKVHYIDTNGWLTNADYTDGLHPSVSGHIKAANLLLPILQPYINGTVGAGVTFYQDVNYGGSASQLLTPGDYTMAQLAAKGMPDNWASSVKVPAGRTVTMYADDNFGGQSWTFTSDTPNFTITSLNANDKVSSVKVQ